MDQNASTVKVYLPQPSDAEVAGWTAELLLGEVVYTAIHELEQGDHATAGRDFGRGVSFAVKLIRERLTEHYEPAADWIDDDSMPAEETFARLQRLNLQPTVGPTFVDCRLGEDVPALPAGTDTTTDQETE